MISIISFREDRHIVFRLSDFKHQFMSSQSLNEGDLNEIVIKPPQRTFAKSVEENTLPTL